MAGGNIKGITIEIGGETSGLQNALKGVNDTSRNLQGELKNVEKLLKFDPTNAELLAQKQTLLTEAVENTKNKLDTLKEAERQVQQQFENGEVSAEQYRNLQREIISTQQNLERLETAAQNVGNGLGDGASELSGDLDNAGDSAATFGDVLKANVIGQAVVDGVKALGDAIKDIATQTDAATGMVQAKLGVTKEDAEKLTEVAKNVWKNGFGEDITDVTNNLATVRQYLGDMSDEEMQGVLENAYTISDVFGADVNESVKSVKTMMENFGISSTEAFDLITVGYQNGLDYSGEFLDTLNEYAPQFEKMGFSAEDALNMLINGADNGAFSLDKVADSMKEFSLRIVDGSDTTREGLDLIGVDYDNLTAKLSDGSLTQEEAMKQVINALANTDDSVVQAQAGAALFGTQWEDVGSDVILSLGNVNETLGSVEGATKTAGDAAYDNLGTKFDTALRGIKDAFAPLAEQLLDLVNNIMPQVQAALQWISDNSSIVVTAIGAIATAFAVIKIGTFLTSIGGIAGIAPTIVTALGGISTAIAVIGGPITIIIAAVAALVAAFVVLWDTNEDFRNKIIEIWNGIKDFLSGAIEAIKTFFTTGFETIKTTVTTIFDGIKTTITSIFETVKTVISTAIEVIKKFFTDGFEFIKKAVENYFQAIKTVIDTVLKVISTLVSAYMQTVQGIFKTIMQAISGDWSGAWNTLKTTCSNLLSGISTVISTSLNGIKTVFSGLVGNAFSWGKNLISGFIDGIKSMIGKVKDTASSVTKAVSGYLGFNSPSKEGEGRFITDWGENMIGGFLEGVKNAIPDVSSVVGQATSVAGQALNSTTTSNVYSGGNVTINMYNPQVASTKDINNVSRQLQKQITTQNRTLGIA